MPMAKSDLGGPSVEFFNSQGTAASHWRVQQLINSSRAQRRMENAGTVGFVFSPPRMTWRGKWGMICSLSRPPSSGPSHRNMARSPGHTRESLLPCLKECTNQDAGGTIQSSGQQVECRIQSQWDHIPCLYASRLQWVPSSTPDSTARGAWHVDIHVHVCVHTGIYNMSVCIYMKYACKCIHTYIKHRHKHKQARRKNIHMHMQKHLV